MKNSELLAKWESSINKNHCQRNKWKASQFSHICSKHFLKTDFTHDGSRRLKFNAVPSVFNESHPEHDLPSLVNTLLDGPPACQATMSLESVESASSDIAMVSFPPDATVTHPEHDLTLLVNTLLDGPPAQATMSSESLESASSDIAMVPFPPDATVTYPEHDLTSLVNTLLDVLQPKQPCHQSLLNLHQQT